MVKSWVVHEYGYCRVSSREQNLDRQLIAMQGLGLKPEQIYTDKQSGKNFNRPGYESLMKKLREHDVLYIKSIDRLGRNYDEILEQWRKITKKIKADIVVLDMPVLDTRTDRNLLGSFICDTVLGVLSFVAENERVNIRQRQAEGIAAAKARGVHCGRKAKPLPENFDECYMQWFNGRMTGTDAAKNCGMPLSTFFDRAKARRRECAAGR